MAVNQKPKTHLIQEKKQACDCASHFGKRSVVSAGVCPPVGCFVEVEPGRKQNQTVLPPAPKKNTRTIKSFSRVKKDKKKHLNWHRKKKKNPTDEMR